MRQRRHSRRATASLRCKSFKTLNPQPSIDEKPSPIIRFMLRTALFALIVGCLLGAGEWAVRRYVPNPYRTKAERMEHGPMPRSIVLGNSHSYYGVRPDMLPAPAVSLANVLAASGLRSRNCCATAYLKPRTPSRQPALHRGTRCPSPRFRQRLRGYTSEQVPLHKTTSSTWDLTATRTLPLRIRTSARPASTAPNSKASQA